MNVIVMLIDELQQHALSCNSSHSSRPSVPSSHSSSPEARALKPMAKLPQAAKTREPSGVTAGFLPEISPPRTGGRIDCLSFGPCAPTLGASEVDGTVRLSARP